MMEPPKHHTICEWHLDQYPWECTCGLTAPKPEWFDNATKEFEERMAQKGVTVTYGESGRMRMVKTYGTKTADTVRVEILTETKAGMHYAVCRAGDKELRRLGPYYNLGHAKQVAAQMTKMAAEFVEH